MADGSTPKLEGILAESLDEPPSLDASAADGVGDDATWVALGSLDATEVEGDAANDEEPERETRIRRPPQAKRRREGRPRAKDAKDLEQPVTRRGAARSECPG